MTARSERVENVTQVVILLLVGGMAGAASFTHVHDWTMVIPRLGPGSGSGGPTPWSPNSPRPLPGSKYGVAAVTGTRSGSPWPSWSPPSH